MGQLRIAILMATACAAAFADTLVVPDNQATTAGDLSIAVSGKLNRTQEVVRKCLAALREISSPLNP